MDFGAPKMDGGAARACHRHDGGHRALNGAGKRRMSSMTFFTQYPERPGLSTQRMVVDGATSRTPARTSTRTGTWSSAIAWSSSTCTTRAAE